MKASFRSFCCAALLACVMTVPASADIVVSAVPATQTVNIGDVFTIDIVANIPASEAIIGWGMDATIADSGILSQVGLPSVGPLWAAVSGGDGDALCAADEFPVDGVFGTDVLLATMTFEAMGQGVTELVLSDDFPLDTMEGFVLSDLSGFASVSYGNAMIEVVPEPTVFALLGLGSLVLIRRRR